jgi:YbbR domain-containing protein
LIRWFVNNRGTKALSLLLGILVWYGIQEAISFEVVLTGVDIDVLVDPGWTVIEKSRGSADVVFRGSRSDIRALNRDEVRVVLDARNLTSPGTRTMAVSTDQVRAPPAIRPVTIRPASVSVSVDRESERVVPVRAELSGQPPEGYEAKGAVCLPASVRVIGGSMVLDRIQVVRTQPVELDGRAASFVVDRPLLMPPGPWAFRMEPDHVTVEVSIREHASVRTLSGVPIRILTQAGSKGPAEIVPASVAVTLQGRSEVLDGLGPEDLHAYIVCEALQEGSAYELPVQSRVPAGVRVTAVEPAAVTVRTGIGP